jgi:hypothetical protein
MSSVTRHNLLYLTVFGIAMGFLEAIVVVYIREIYYPHGFQFPMVLVSGKIITAELAREFCTIIMLLAVAFIAGNTSLQRFSYFIFSFAIWDIFYYAGLKIFLNWPPSLLTWDILFLIPVAWLAPVLAPILCAVTMIILSIMILYLQDKRPDFHLRIWEWASLSIGALLILITFLWDFSKMLIGRNLLSHFFALAKNEEFLHLISTFVPYYYNWALFSLGLGIIYVTLILLVKRHYGETKVQKKEGGLT